MHGPSAGVAIVVSLASLLLGCPPRADTAMTGEITLTGRVLAVGGVKEKVLAAHRAGIRRVILPQQNARSLHEVPASVRDTLEFVFIGRVEDVLRAAFPEGSLHAAVTGAQAGSSAGVQAASQPEDLAQVQLQSRL